MENSTRFIKKFTTPQNVVTANNLSLKHLALAVATVVPAMVMFAVYGATLAPGITWRNGGTDSGELATAVASLGIAHPPGYPVYILLGRLWTLLPWGGDVAYRLNMLSAFSAALAGAITIALIFKINHICAQRARLVGAVFGGALLMIAPLTWSQATITEVYAPGLLWVAMVSFIFLRKTRLSAREIGFGGALLGVGVGILPQIVLLLPAVGLVVFLNGRQSSSRISLWRQLGWLSLGFVAGMGVFLFLPLRALAHPAANWGNPVNLANFWDLVTARQYQHLVQPASGEWFIRLRQSAGQLVAQLSLSGAFLALWGGIWLWQRARTATVFLLFFLMATLLFRAGYPVDGNAVYLLPALFVLAVFAGIGLTVGLIFTRQYVGSAAMVILGVLMLVSLVWRGTQIFPLVDISADRQAGIFGQTVMAKLPLDAVVVTDRDETTFSLWYQQTLGNRNDVVVVDKRLLFYEWYVQNLVYQFPDLQPAMLQPNRVQIPARAVVYVITPEQISDTTFSYELIFEPK